MFRKPAKFRPTPAFSAKSYVSPSSPFAFAGINAIRKDGLVSANEAKQVLHSMDAYTRHRQRKKPKTNPYFVHRLRELGQGDLCDKSNLAEWNDDYKFLLCVMDTFSRFLWVRPIKNKSGAAMTEALDSIFSEVGRQGRRAVFERFLTDAGTEFLSASARKVYRKHNVHHQTANVHASHVERKQRDLQQRIGQYLTERETRRYIHVLPDIVHGLNHAYHRILHMSAAQAERAENHVSVRFAMAEYFEKSRSQSHAPSIKVGEWVRVVTRGTFRKSYDETFSTDFYRVKKILTHMPRPMYIIEDPNGVEERGFYYEEELSPFRSDVFKVKQVLKRRKKRGRTDGAEESLVEWLGFPRSKATWVDNSQLTDPF